jgi:hypothetical protein
MSDNAKTRFRGGAVLNGNGAIHKGDAMFSPHFHATGWHSQIRSSSPNSDHFAPRVSPVLAAVRIVNLVRRPTTN